METRAIVWVIVLVVVLAAVAAFVLSRSGARRADAQRAKAAEIREKAGEHDQRLREDQASATEANARAEIARAEAQRRELEAERLAEEAQTRSQSADALRRERDEQLRLADLRDPDVSTDKDGYRIDERGNRLPTDGVGTGGTRDGGDEHGHAGDGIDGRDRRDAESDRGGSTLDRGAGSDDEHRPPTA